MATATTTRTGSRSPNSNAMVGQLHAATNSGRARVLNAWSIGVATALRTRGVQREFRRHRRCQVPEKGRPEALAVAVLGQQVVVGDNVRTRRIPRDEGAHRVELRRLQQRRHTARSRSLELKRFAVRPLHLLQLGY